MTISILDAKGDSSGTSATSASISPAANALILAFVSSNFATSASPNTPTASGGGLSTWVVEETVEWDTGDPTRKRLTVLRGMSGSPSGPATVTFDFAGQSQSIINYVIVQITDVNTGGTNGSAACVQSVPFSDESGSTQVPSITLASFADATNNICLGCFNFNSPGGNVARAVGSGFTLNFEGYTNAADSPWTDLEIIVESKTGEDTSVDYDLGYVGALIGGIALEISVTPPQTAAPTSDISAGSWSPSTGATLYGVLDEASPGTDSDYISTTTSSDTAKVKFASVTDPAVSTGHLLRYRIRATSTDQLTAYVYQGTTLIATDTTRAPGPTETTYTLTLSGAEADSITDYSDIRAWFTSGTHGGATSTAAKFPTVASDASEDPYVGYTWSNISNITADDTNYATITHPSFDNNVYSYVAYAKGFDFSAIPDGSTITGVECIASTWWDAGSANGVLAQLLSDTGVRGGTNMWATPVTLTNTVGDTKTIGGSGQTWGNSLTAAWVKDADFGVAIALRATSNNTDVSIDYVTLKIYYTPPAADWRVTWTQWEVPEATAPEVPDWDWTRTPYNTLLRM